LGKVCQGEINSRVAAKSFDVRARLWTADFGMEEFRKVYEFTLLRWEKVAPVFKEKFFFTHGLGGFDCASVPL